MRKLPNCFNGIRKIAKEKSIFFLLVPILCALPLTGCVNYKNQMKKTTADYQAGRFEKTKTTLVKQAKKKVGTRDELVWRLEEAAALRTANCLPESTESLVVADTMIRNFEENEANVRLGQEALSAFSNPANITYEGWTTDRIMVSTYLGVNNIILGNEDQARVHLNMAYQRQRDAVDKNAKRITKEQEEIQKEKESDKVVKDASNAVQDEKVQGQVGNLYTDLDLLTPVKDYVNPFTSYLRGLFLMLYGTDSSDMESAHKSFEQAYAFAKDNKYVAENYALADKLANGETLEKGVTYVIFENGLAPYLQQIRIDLPLPISGGIYSANVAFPIFKTYPDQGNTLEVKAGNVTEQTQLIANMDDIFGADFKSEVPRITARIIAAVAIRQATTIAANLALKSSGNSYAQIIGGLAIWAGQTAINIADTRTWTLLPHDFQVCQLATPADGKLIIRETRSNQSITIDVSPSNTNFVFVKYVTPNGKMTIWSKKVSKQ